MMYYPIKYSPDELNRDIVGRLWELTTKKGSFLFESLIRKIIRKIQKYGEETMILGEDTGLNNLWDEYCAQVQSDYGWLFGLQKDLVEITCLNSLKELKEKNELDYDILVLYISVCYFEEAEESRFPLFSDEEIALKIFDEINSRAMSYSNKRINDYIFK